MIMNDNGDQMIYGDLGGLKLPDICLTGDEVNPDKTSLRKLVPTGDRTRARCVTGTHATAQQLGISHGFVQKYMDNEGGWLQHLRQ